MPVDDSDFVPIGDNGSITIVTEAVGFGEGGFGEGPFGGGTQTIIIESGDTVWTEIDEP